MIKSKAWLNSGFYTTQYTQEETEYNLKEIEKYTDISNEGLKGAYVRIVEHYVNEYKHTDSFKEAFGYEAKEKSNVTGFFKHLEKNNYNEGKFTESWNKALSLETHDEDIN